MDYITIDGNMIDRLYDLLDENISEKFNHTDTIIQMYRWLESGQLPSKIFDMYNDNEKGLVNELNRMAQNDLDRFDSEILRNNTLSVQKRYHGSNFLEGR